MGEEAFAKGSAILMDFFKSELKQFLAPELDELGKDIIEKFISGASVEELNALMPGKYIQE